MIDVSDQLPGVDRWEKMDAARDERPDWFEKFPYWIVAELVSAQSLEQRIGIMTTARLKKFEDEMRELEADCFRRIRGARIGAEVGTRIVVARFLTNEYDMVAAEGGQPAGHPASIATQ